MKYLKIILLAVLGSLFVPLYAQWSYPVTNYSRKECKSASQNWQISQSSNGWIYTGNSSGLLEYNGQNWNLYPINHECIRSVMIVPRKRIYVGGIAEFGYYEPDAFGKLKYVSLSESVIKKYGSFGNVWYIHQIDQCMYYQTDDMIIKYQMNGNVTYIRANMQIYCSEVIDGMLLLGTKKGIFALLGERLVPVANAGVLSDKRIRYLLRLDNHRLLICTERDGLYIYENDTVTKMETEADQFLAENGLFCCAASKNYIALGSVRRGVVVINRDGRIMTYSNMSNGLQDNTVLSLNFDASENLWMGLNKGLSFLRLNGALSTLYSPPNFYGMGYAAQLVKDKMLLATNEGLYSIRWPIQITPNSPKLDAVNGLGGQVWGLNKIGGQIFCAHDKGLFIVDGERIVKSFDTGGAWNCKMLRDSSGLMVGTYSGLYIIPRSKGQWQTPFQVRDFYESCRYFEEDQYGIWISNDQYGIIRLQLSPDKKTIRKRRHYNLRNGLLQNKTVEIQHLKGHVIFITSSGVYRYNPLKDSMEPDSGPNGANRYFSKAEPARRFAEFNHNIWSISEHQVNLFTPGKVYSENIKDGLELKEDYELLYPISATSALIGTEKGFLQMQFQKKVSSQEHLLLQIKSVMLSGIDSLLYRASIAHQSGVPEVRYRYNSFRFEFSAVEYLLNSDVKYSYKLDGYDEWSSPGKQTVKEYTNLHEGRYTFRVMAITSSGLKGYDEFVFEILPPWYRSWWAYLIYLCAVVYAAVQLFRMDKIRLHRHEQVIKQREQAEMEVREREFRRIEMEREKEIIRLKNEQLEVDLLHKNQELSNVLLNFVRKNESLTEIKKDIQKILLAMTGKEDPSIKRKLYTLNNKIDQNMEHDEDWKKFERNFDIVHNGFIQKLTEKYPELTYSEKKMCVYLKMDLSSKEIASLLNISPRSVETVRYRLRKKFDLEREDNLRDFLNKV